MQGRGNALATRAATGALEPTIHGQAHTSLQLLQQLDRDGYSGDGLQLVRRALALASELFACRFQCSGEPFMVHAIGAASILSSLGASPALVAAGLVHAAYGNGDFGDAREGAAEWKRDVVRRALGDEVEEYVYGFWCSLPWPRERIDRLALQLDSAAARDRAVLLLRLADLAEHHRDLGQLFGGRQREARDLIERLGPVWLRLAADLAGPEFAADLKRLFEATASARLPDELCGLTGHTGSFQLLPRSYRPRLSVALRQQAGPMRDLLRRGLSRLRQRRFGHGLPP